jgi:hypothetical protein
MRKALLLMAVLLCTSCAVPQPRVTHVVMCWLKNPGSASDRQRLIDESEKFKKIPGVVSVTAGGPIASTRPVVDSSFDVGVVIAFKDEAAMTAYEANPIHVKAVKEVLKPLSAKLVIYDVRNGKTGAPAQAEAGAHGAPASPIPQPGNLAANPVTTP